MRAGNLTIPTEKEAVSAMVHMTLHSPSRDPEEVQYGQHHAQIRVEVGPEDKCDSRATDTLAFAIDTLSNKPMSTSLPSTRVRSPSPTPSSSSGEVILFRGRDNNANSISRNTQSPERIPLANSFDARMKAVEERIHIQEELFKETLQKELSEETSHRKSSSLAFCEGLMTKQPTSTHHSNSFAPVIFGRKKRNRGRGRRTKQAAEVDAILADYLVNMDSDDGDLLASAPGFSARELGVTDDDAWQETDNSSDEAQSSEAHLKGGWDSNIEDLGEMSTSDGSVGELRGIFSKRERMSGFQYLVVCENETMDDARWVPASTLTSVVAQALIKAFEAEKKLTAQFAAASDDDDDDDDNNLDSINGGMMTDGDGEDDVDRLQSKIKHKGDEHIARLLAKQEELGMGSGELLLFDDAADADEEDAVPLPDQSFNPFMLPQQKLRSKQSKRHFPAASALADAYDRFDVMDFERPSLMTRPKGHKGKIVVDGVDDSEFIESMHTAWGNDRIKKKQRKQEREELRRQGLLGSRNGKPDLKDKYKEGMGIKAIKNEMKSFLMSNHTTLVYPSETNTSKAKIQLISLALPPMDKTHRKIVHEVANAFRLESKSIGNGSNRAPVLVRTARTSAFMERTWAQVDSQTARGFLPRIDFQAKRGGRKVSRGGSGGFNNAAVSYRDGETVGGSAPELGAENKGRAMLEKMGWSSGTALGALNNKGILEPVSHVVKTTKAGLG